ncbi:MAG: hypothetical protein AAGG68_30745 [Bacteroidota bacterium]
MAFTINLGSALPTNTTNITQQTDLSKTMSSMEVDMMKMSSSFSVMCHVEHVDELLQTPTCGGIRLYPANANDNMATSPIPSLLVVAVDENGEDLVTSTMSNLATPCYICQPNGDVNKVSEETARGMINNLKPNIQVGTVFEPLRNTLSGNTREYFKATFTRKIVEDILATPNIRSVRFDIVNLNVLDNTNIMNLKTLAISPADDSGNIVDGNAELSLLPCPPKCPQGYID